MSDEMPNDDRTPDQLARRLDAVTAPAALHGAVEEAVAAAGRARARRGPSRIRLAPALAAVGALVVALLAVVLVTGGDDGPAPSVRQVAHVALGPAAEPAPAAAPGGELLTASAGPIAFPTWTRAGWHAVGERTDEIGGYELRTVFYADDLGRRIGYTIADATLPAAGGRVLDWEGARIRVLDPRDGARVVTWERDGRTCILAARDVGVGKLVTLAGYAA
jgi:hypothetical protein